MITSRKYRIYPNEEQKVVLENHFNAVRFVYNLALETKNVAYYSYGHNYSRYDLQKQLLEVKNELSFLKEVNSQSIQASLMHLDAAYTTYFRQLKDGTIAKRKEAYISKRNKKKLDINWDKYHSIGKPKFKSKKDDKNSFLVPQNFTIVDNKLYIPKLKTGIKVVLSREIGGEMKNITISKTNTGKYFVSIIVESKEECKPLRKIKDDTAIGIDMGLKSFIIDSNGNEYNNPKFLRKSLPKLKYEQRKLSKKKKGSKNKEKQRLKLAKIYEKVSNQRLDFLHKTSSAITKQYDTVCVEDLAIKNMVQNRKLALSISDASWGTFLTLLKYKCNREGVNYIVINRWYPSSKTHSECGYVNNNLKLSDREWMCPNCSKIVSRDVNAAINIKMSGLGKPKELVELPTVVGALKQESRFL